MALAKINQIAKEGLKRSVSSLFYRVRVRLFANSPTRQQPLRATKAVEGGHSRDVEVYLEGLLRALRPVEPTRILFDNGVELIEEDTRLATFSRRKYFPPPLRFGQELTSIISHSRRRA